MGIITRYSQSLSLVQLFFWDLMYFSVYCLPPSMHSDDFIKFWVDENIVSMDKATQVFRILKQPDNNYLTKVCYSSLIFLKINRTFFSLIYQLCWTLVCAERLWTYYWGICGNSSLPKIPTECTFLSKKIWYIFLMSLYFVSIIIIIFSSNAFLESAGTVIYTIFYYVDHAGHGCITLKDLKHGDLILALQKVQEDEDLDESNFKK